MLRTYTYLLHIRWRHIAVASVVIAPVLLLGSAHCQCGHRRARHLSDTDNTNSMDYGPATSKTKTAECPEGTKIIGGGLLGNQVADGLVITQLQPIDASRGGAAVRACLQLPDEWECQRVCRRERLDPWSTGTS